MLEMFWIKKLWKFGKDLTSLLINTINFYLKGKRP